MLRKSLPYKDFGFYPPNRLHGGDGCLGQGWPGLARRGGGRGSSRAEAEAGDGGQGSGGNREWGWGKKGILFPLMGRIGDLDIAPIGVGGLIIYRGFRGILKIILDIWLKKFYIWGEVKKMDQEKRERIKKNLKEARNLLSELCTTPAREEEFLPIFHKIYQIQLDLLSPDEPQEAKPAPSRSGGEKNEM
jgi:hypothetical protein